MSKAYVFYNPLAGNGHCKESLDKLKETISDELIFCDMTETDTYEKIFPDIIKDDYIIVCGGDGTLNRFANFLANVELDTEILYFPAGTGNDFAHDMNRKFGAAPFSITKYLKPLPTVEVNGKTHYFINGVGYGIDGYCCEVGDEQKKKSAKPVNYASIAVKGLLFHYKRTEARVTVDGVVHTYKNVWLAPTMYGRFYGNGMMPIPNQERGKHTLSVMVFHCPSKLKTLAVFPGIFKGEHVKHTDVIEVLTGSEISVEFNTPASLQIDGETVLNVTSYKACAVPAGVKAAVS